MADDVEKVIIAWFAVKGLSTFVLLLALLLACGFKWVHQQRPDRWRTFGFVIANILNIISAVLQVTFAILYDHVSELAFYTVLNIGGLLNGISEVMILAVVARTVHQLLFGDIKAVGNNRLLRGLGIVALVIILLILVAEFAISTAYVISYIDGKELNATWPMRAAVVGYFTGYLIFTFWLFVMAVMGWAKKKTRTRTSLLITLVVVFLGIRAATILAYFTITEFTGLRSLDAPSVYAYDIITMFIFLGVALIALSRPSPVKPPQSDAVPLTQYTEYAGAHVYHGLPSTEHR